MIPGAAFSSRCRTCGREIASEAPSCPHCGADLHVCKNCRLYDPNLHNQCREPEASFIRDRAEANFCTHFDFKDSDGWKQDTSVASAKAKLEALFKNLK